MSGGQENAPFGWQADTGRDRALANAAGDKNIAQSQEIFKIGNASVAINLARAGLPVFPCREDKKPLVQWKESATTDAETVAHWWLANPNALVGLPTGGRSGVFVIDVDIDRDTGEAKGEANLVALGFGDLLTDSTQPRVRTPSGGIHLFFRHEEGLRNSAGTLLGSKIDTRGEGGYVIAPGSTLRDGRAYEPELAIDWCALPELPANLRRAPTSLARSEDVGVSFEAAGSSAWGEAALRGERERVAAAPVGQRNDTLNRSAFRLGQVVAGEGLDVESVKGGLRDAALAAGLD